MHNDCKQLKDIQDAVIRIDGYFFYQLGAALRPLETIGPDHDYLSIRREVGRAKEWLNSYLNHDVFRPAHSRAVGLELLALLDEIPGKGSGRIGISYAYRIEDKLRAFEAVLDAELELRDLYWVTQKRGLDNKVLIGNAMALFPSDLPQKVPAAKFDIEQAGRCIAFELSTAAGFHVLRAIELVLHRYYEVVTEGADPPKGRNMGGYLKVLREKGCGDGKIISALENIKDHHRNPLIHPEESFESIDDAIALLNTLHTVVVPILKVIPAPPVHI